MSGNECSLCNTEFSCNADEGMCWCMSYTLSAEQLEYLNNNYSGCLCPECLKKYADSSEEE